MGEHLALALIRPRIVRRTLVVVLRLTTFPSASCESGAPSSLAIPPAVASRCNDRMALSLRLPSGSGDGDSIWCFLPAKFGPAAAEAEAVLIVRVRCQCLSIFSNLFVKSSSTVPRHSLRPLARTCSCGRHCRLRLPCSLARAARRNVQRVRCIARPGRPKRGLRAACALRFSARLVARSLRR